MIRKTTVLLLAALLLAGCGARSAGNKIDDQVIHPNVNRAIKDAHPDLSSPTTHTVVTSYNGVILIAGETPREDLRQIATRAAQSVDGVKVVHNELRVAYPTPINIRANDSLLTTKVKARLTAETDVPSTKVKVVTVNGVVYLLGIVSRTEADNITYAVRQVGGVQKIVRLFEYID